MKGAVGLPAGAGASVLASTLVLACASACSREDEKPKQIDLAPPFARAPSPDAGARAAAAAPRDEPWPGDVDSAPPRPIQVIVTRTIVREAGGPPPVNPDDAVLERVRMSAGGCFASLPAGAGYGPPERSAHIVVTVIPTGTVTRAEVSSPDTNDERVMDCIRDRAQGTPFSDNTGGPLRTYAIDVRVIAKGSAGGR